MPDSMLQKFLDAGHLPIGDDDKRVVDLQEAVKTLSTRYKEAPVELISAMLVGIDAESSDQDPVFDQAEGAVKEHWQTFRNKFSDRPRQILRGIIISAIDEAIVDADDAAASVWLAGGNLFPHLKAGADTPILESWLSGLGQRCEKFAQQGFEHHQPQSLMQNLDLNLSDIGAIQVSSSNLLEYMTSAFTPNGNNPNPSTPWTGNHTWATHAAQRSAQGIAHEINTALGELTEQLQQLTESLGQAVSEATSKLVNRASSSPTAGMLASLLWWKETRYSPSLRRTYRGMNPVEVCISTASDIFDLTHAPAPASVEFFLRETVLSILGDDPEISLTDFLKQARESALISQLVPPTSTVTIKRRICLNEYLEIAKTSSPAPTTLPAWLGINRQFKLPVTEWAVWLFRDKQARALSQRRPNP